MVGTINQVGLRMRQGVRRLDRPHQGRRGAARAAASAGPRAQRRHHAVGLGRSQALPARRGLDRPAQPDRQRQRPALRRARAERRLRAGARSEDAHGEPDSAHGARPGHAGDAARHGRSRRRTGATRCIWNSKNNVHNPMLDQQGRALADLGRASVRQPRRSARRAPITRRRSCSRSTRSGRHLQMYDPKTKKLTHIGTCFGTHHLAFAEDANNTLWTSGGGQVVGWLNTKLFEETGDEAKAQGWTALIMDTNGNGKRDAYVEPERAGRSDQGQAVQRRRSTRCSRRPTARSGARCSAIPARPCASCPAATRRRRRWWRCTSRRSSTPIPRRGLLAARHGRRPQRRGVGGAGQRPHGELRPPQVQGRRSTARRPPGQHCPEGWTLYTEPAPQMKGVTDSGSAEASYYTWVDRFDTLGLGARTCRSTPATRPRACWRSRTASGSCCACRIRSATTPSGWTAASTTRRAAGRARGLWSTVSTRAPFHMEGGKGTSSKIVRFQMRPDPLAK